MSGLGGVVAVTSLSLEAYIAQGRGVSVLCSQSADLRKSLKAAIARGARGVISFGIAGGLAPDLSAGDWIIASAVRYGNDVIATHADWARNLRSALPVSVHAELLGSDDLVMQPEEKRALYSRTGAVAVDMESHIAGQIAREYRIPFAVCRTIIDAAHRRLPPAAAIALRPDGTPNLLAVLQSVLQTPSQIPDLLRTACDERTARRALKTGRARLGAALAFPGYDVSAAPLLMGRDLPVSESLATS
jgi:adenosylhomocysteine nucleosidase